MMHGPMNIKIKIKWLYSHNTPCSTHSSLSCRFPTSWGGIAQILQLVKMLWQWFGT